MNKHAVAIPALAVLLFVGGLQVASADPALDQCRAQNNRIHNETMQLFQRARASGRITPQEAQQLAAMEQRLRQFAARLSFGGLTLGECRAMTQALINERNVVARMAGIPGPGQDAQAIGQCRQQNGQIHSETMQLFRRAMAAGSITPQERQQLAQMEQRLRRISQNLARGGLTLNECQAMTQQLINERNIVARMAAAGPGQDAQAIGQCRQQNGQIHSETMQLFRRAMAGGRITPQERQQLAAMEQRLRQISQNLARGGLTLNECRAMTQALIKERTMVAQMAAR